MDGLAELLIRKIVVLRALKLGDFLVATPAFRALRTAFPRARIDYVGLPWARELVTERYRNYFSGFVSFPGFPGLPEQPWSASEVTAFLGRMQQRRYDLALQLHGQGDGTNICVALWGARITAGFAPPDSTLLQQPWYIEYPDKLPETRRLLLLLQHCGIPSVGEELIFPTEPQDEQELAATSAYPALTSPYVCIHPGAASSRPWSAEAFAVVADACANAGYAVAITGTDSEASIAHATVQHMHYPAVIFSGQTSLGALATLLSRAALFIGNDTGTAHLAVAVGTPSVTIFSTSDPRRWAPLNKQKHRVVLSRQASTDRVIRLALEQLGEWRTKPL